MSSIVFDEVSAEIAPPADTGSSTARAAADTAGAAPAVDPLEQVRRALALLREREVRARAD